MSRGIAAGPDGALWFSEIRNGSWSGVGRITSSVDPAVGPPVLAGSGQVGLPLVCTNATWALNPLTVTVSWRRDGAVLPAVTGPSYTPSAADVGHAIGCAQSAVLPAVLTPQTVVSGTVNAIPQVTGPSGPVGPTAPAGPVGPAGPTGPAPLVAVFAPTTLKARTGTRLRVVHAVNSRARLVLRLARRGTVVSAVMTARAGTNSVLLTLKRGRSALPTGVYSLALRTSSGRTLTATRVYVTR